MSYDLHFRKRSGIFERERTLDYFRLRPFYRVENGQAVYGNPDTGVHFVFEVQSSLDDSYDACFTLNYFRPSYFALEAEPEVTAFVHHFDWIVTDPQIEGMPLDRYDGGGFIAAWQRSSAQTLPAFLKDDSNRNRLMVLPTEELTRLWRWNLARSELQSKVGEDKFVPRVSFLARDGHPASTVVWTDGIPMVFPKVDLVILHRHELAPRRFFKRSPDFSLLPWQAALALAGPHLSPYDGETTTMQYVQPPPDVVRSIKSLPASIHKPTLIGADSVLDREWVEKALLTL